MMNGASTLEGYVPDVDATVVQRILDAGGTIVGKTRCEYFCFSGGSHTSATGPVHNPHRHGLFGGRLVLRQRGTGGGRRGADGARRRPRRLDPHAGLVLRHLRHEADARAGALHRHHADRTDPRSYRSDDRDGRGQRAAAGSPRRPGRARSAPVRRPERSRIATRWGRARRGCGSASSRKASATRNRSRNRMRWCARRRIVCAAWARPSKP